MVDIHWIILAVDVAINIIAMLNSLALGRIGRMKPAKRPSGIVYPSLTIVVTAHNQAEELRKHLPTLLLQDYPSPYEVVVVDMASDDETVPILEHLEEKYPQLRHTFTPVTARDISLERLAMTLGIRAASYPWTILLQAGCRPVSPYWLRRMGEAILQKGGTDIVVAPVFHDLGNKGEEYISMWKEMLWLSYATKHGAYRTGQCNVAYRRELFMQHHGFASHALLDTGAIDIMVNHNSHAHNTNVTIRPESMILSTPSGEGKETDLMYMETRLHLRNHHLYRWQYALAVSSLPVALISTLATMLLTGLSEQWWIMATAALVMLTNWTIYHHGYSRSMRILGLTPPRPTMHLYALAIPFKDLHAWLRHKTTNRRTFRKKFI